MDWFKWLSKSNLEPSLVHQYGLLFTHNDLREDDIPFFNHDFLLSMGITMAKHRLEILKLLTPPPTKPHAAAAPMSRALVAVKRTRKSFSKYILNAWGAKQQREDKSKTQAVVPVSDDTATTCDHQNGCRLKKGLTMLKRSSRTKMQPPAASAATTPDTYYSYNRQQQKQSFNPKTLSNGGRSPMSMRTPRIGSFSASSPFRQDFLEMVHMMNGHGNNEDLDDGYWSAGVEETRWDAMFHTIKPT
uniref:SAM domain-containing protein n=1 Tax=Kalanchoe fedtschenkoi TaxID=63787 RepID=A0A7N0TIC8_KALFE